MSEERTTIRNGFGDIAWNLDGQVRDNPVSAREEEKQRIRKAAGGKSRNRCSCVGGAQCHQPLLMPQCQGLRSKLRQMRVAHPICCLRKKITKSDVDRGQHRLLLPKELLSKRVLKILMSADEERQTAETSGLAVRTLDRMGREYNLTLRFLDTINAYRIMGRGHYTRFVEDNGFRPGQMVDVLVFRIPPERKFAMAVINYEKDEAENSSSSSAAEAAAGAQDPVSFCGQGNAVDGALLLMSMSRGKA